MAREPARPEQIVELYVDESSQTKHRFLGMGLLAVRGLKSEAFAEVMAAERLPDLPEGEMAWVKVSRTKLGAYKRIVDVFFDNPTRTLPLQFHMLVIDTHQLRDKAFNQGSREIGFNKEIYQICQKAAKIYKYALFNVYPDSRTTKSDTEELRLILNRGRRKAGDTRDWPFRRLHFRNSAETLPLQMADILLGAVMYRINGHHLARDASPAKLELSEYLLKRAGIADVMKSTRFEGKFTIWHRLLKS